MNLKQVFLRYFLPTITEVYQAQHEQYKKEYEPTIGALEIELGIIERCIVDRRRMRSALVNSMRYSKCIPVPSSSEAWPSSERRCGQAPSRSQSWDSVSTVFGPANYPSVCGSSPRHSLDDNAIFELRERIEDVQALQSYAEELKKSINDCRFLVDTQATADLTGYRELRDWAKTMLQAYEYATTVLISISTVGASLVYTTIFSASRGNIGYMCLTFPLFIFAFVVSVMVQISLRWAASLPNPVAFASQTLWKYIIRISLALAALSVLSALAVLNVTIFFLDPGSSSSSIDNDISLNTVGGVTKGIVSIPGIAVFAVCVLGFLILCGAIGVSVFACRRSCLTRHDPVNLTADAVKRRNELSLESFKSCNI
ncbi:hypothetical protein JR316_0003126 [Psilocybe cubensis]|uniref:Uncharacterized protein n=2 Tax=Psilocybe cubensis TaxID=181762 RepID=A0ACB8H833_PSICU|nr:hypothetical protein JR316_0003126 [Psilocybe cubensis]KAH9483656.1 hypothetical protein JR316_0003126 [Psilocybe cubensis]